MYVRMYIIHVCILYPINVCTYVHMLYVCIFCTLSMYVCMYIRAYVVRMHFAPCHVCTNVRLLYFVRKSSTTESVHLCHDVLVCRTHVLLSVFIASYDYLYNIYL